MRWVSMATKAELVAAIGDRYRAGARTERSKILNEFVVVTGYHRKHAIRLLRPKISDCMAVQRWIRRRYGAEVQQALALWETSDRLCSKRPKPIILVLLSALERHGQLAIDGRFRALLLAISPETIDRLLSQVCLAARGGRRRCAGQCVAQYRCGRSAIGTTRRQSLSRSILSLMQAPRLPAALSRRWC